jgi:ATP adenylyltransferase
MTFEELSDFIKNRMSMSHIYQPLLIKYLIEAGGSATLRQLALDFLQQDESQLIYYEKRIKEMPLKVLSKHQVLAWDGKLITLNTGKLTYQEKAQIKVLCENRLQDFIRRKGLAIWDYRLLDTQPVPDSLRFQVLRNSGGRCALCGATKRESVLDVDHIIPRSRGGRTAPENLQVLCAKCNRSKGNRDSTDFRKDLETTSDPHCPFCTESVKSRIIEENGTVIAIMDKYPVTEFHTLVLPHRHTPDYFTMTSQERRDSEDLIRFLRNEIQKQDSSVKGFNIGTNHGQSAGQTIMHAHLHLIPRRNGDTPNPRGGVRGVIPEKMAY